MSIKKVFKSWKIWLLIICFAMALVAIHPNPWNEGVAIRSVIKETSAVEAGFINPKATSTPMSREVISAINNIPIKNIDDYSKIIDTLQPDTTVIIKTNKNTYRLNIKPVYETIVLNETETVEYVEEVFNSKKNITENVTKTKLQNKTLQKVVGKQDIGLRVYDAPKSNIRMGLDLQGGSRVILSPETQITQQELDSLVENMKQRLNVYGLSDISVRAVKDFDGKDSIVVEIAGATDEEVKGLLANQGKFEGRIGNDSMFKGGQDIKYVCKTPECSRVTDCSRATEGYFCRFQFAITLSPESAQRQADRTKDLTVVVEGGEGFLSENLDLYLDDELVDSLRIGEGLKGRAETDISISGSGAGLTQQEALSDAGQNMKRLQTILVTGSLPVKLVIEDTNNVSAVLGSEFIQNTLFVGLIAMFGVMLAIVIRYRKIVVSVPVVVTLLSEVVILLGFAAIIGWNIDLISIAAIIIAIGTGVDSQIVIIDEIAGKRKDDENAANWKDKIKNAFFIIMVSYLTLVVAMIPLLSAGAGLLKGFAITTILGVSIGVFITRPAFAVIAENLLHKDE